MHNLRIINLSCCSIYEWRDRNRFDFCLLSHFWVRILRMLVNELFIFITTLCDTTSDFVQFYFINRLFIIIDFSRSLRKQNHFLRKTFDVYFISNQYKHVNRSINAIRLHHLLYHFIHIYLLFFRFASAAVLLTWNQWMVLMSVVGHRIYVRFSALTTNVFGQVIAIR